MAFTVTFLLAIGSSWVLFHQIGSQLLGGGARGETWKSRSFVLVAILALVTWFLTTIVSIPAEYGYSFSPISAKNAAIGFFTIAILASAEGYGFLRLLFLIRYGRKAAGEEIWRSTPKKDVVERYHGTDIETFRMERLEHLVDGGKDREENRPNSFEKS